MSGIEIINSPDASTVNDAKKFTGVIPYNVVAINPDMQQLHAIGLTFVKKEPIYQREFGTEKRKSTLVDVWLKSVPSPKHPDLAMVTKLTFFINNDEFVSQNTGKCQYVNKYGRTAWAAQPEDLNNNAYFVNEDARQSFRGEEDLYKFLFAWLNMTYDLDRKIFNPCRIDVQKLFSSDYSELQDIVTKAAAYSLKVLTGVRKVEADDGTVRYYATTYNKYFLKHNQKSVEGLMKFVNKDSYNEFKDAFHYTWKIVEFDVAELPDEDIQKQDNPAIPVGGSDPF
jgi:hypothetical protein